MGLRNIPTSTPAPLASLVVAREGMVASRSLTRVGEASMTLLAFAAGESVSEEVYPQDVMYFLVEGEAIVSLPDGAVTMREGDVLCVAAGTPSLLPVEVTAPGLTSCSRIAK